MFGCRRCLLALVIVAMAGSLAGVSPVSAATVPVWPAASEFGALPSNATGSDLIGAFDGISCTSRGNCVAVDGAMVATEKGGVWGQAQELALPANASTASYAHASLASVSCTSQGYCVAVGHYTDMSEARQAMVVTETGGVWGQGQELALPANASTASYVQASLASVSCTGHGYCVAVGRYRSTLDSEHAMAVSETGGVWGQAQELAPPANATTDRGPDAALASVSCTSRGHCVAVGHYVDMGNRRQAMAVTETGGVWAPAQELALPVSPGGAVASSVSCASQGYCAAVGVYSDVIHLAYTDTGNEHAMVVTETGGVWGQAQELALPANARTASYPPVEVNSVSCTSPGYCVAGGSYWDTSISVRAMVATETGGVWARAQELALPANAFTERGFQPARGSVASVSCTSPGYCVAGGSYKDASERFQAMVASSVGSLSVTSTSLPPASVGTAYRAQLSGLGGAGGYRWSLVAGSLPAGLSLSSGGVISGVPGAIATASFTVRVSDPGPPAQQASATLSLVVNPPPPATIVARFGDQRITLTTSSPLMCVTRSGKLAVKFNSTRIPHSKRARLRFSSVSFFIDKGRKHNVHTGVHGKRKIATVYVANATRRHVPVTLDLSLAGLKAGRHTLKVVIRYQRTVRKHGHRTTIMITKTLRVEFSVC